MTNNASRLDAVKRPCRKWRAGLELPAVKKRRPMGAMARSRMVFFFMARSGR